MKRDSASLNRDCEAVLPLASPERPLNLCPHAVVSAATIKVRISSFWLSRNCARSAEIERCFHCRVFEGGAISGNLFVCHALAAAMLLPLAADDRGHGQRALAGLIPADMDGP